MTSGGSNFKDLSGMVFGSLSVIRRVENIGNRVRYLVLCSCKRSKEFYADAKHLRRGETTSCKICGYERIRLANLKDLTGQIFGKLTVIKISEKYISPKGELKNKWICRCGCGRSDDFCVIGNDLKQGKTLQCKICHNEIVGKRSFRDLSGKIFGQLEVIKRAEDYVSPKGRRIVQWVCKCDCKRSNNFIARADALNNGHVISCSKCGRERMASSKESDIATQLKQYCSDKYSKTETEYRIYINPETNYYLPYDIYIPCGNNEMINGVYIEVHGGQHYKFVPFWHKTEEKFKYNKELDKLKRNFAKKNGIYIEIDLRKIKTVDSAISYVNKILLY